jgi:hypothetical protein
VTNVGTTTPVEDFKKLINLGFQFSAGKKENNTENPSSPYPQALY